MKEEKLLKNNFDVMDMIMIYKRLGDSQTIINEILEAVKNSDECFISILSNVNDELNELTEYVVNDINEILNISEIKDEKIVHQYRYTKYTNKREITPFDLFTYIDIDDFKNHNDFLKELINEHIISTDEANSIITLKKIK